MSDGRMQVCWKWLRIHWWAVLGVAAPLVLRFVAKYCGAESAFLDGLLTTSVGILVGVPVALALNRKTLQEAELLATSKAQGEKASRHQKMLNLIHGELQANQLAIEARHKDGKRIVLSGALNVQLWQSLSGELGHLVDLDILNCLTDAYALTNDCIRLENKFLEANFYGGIRVANENPVTHQILNLLKGTDPALRKALQVALDAIASRQK